LRGLPPVFSRVMGMETTKELWRSCYLTVANGCKEKWLGVRPKADKRERISAEEGAKTGEGLQIRFLTVL